MANKVVENKILKLSIDDASLKKGLANALENIKGLKKGIDGVKADGLTKVGTAATNIGDKFQGLVSKIPIVGKVASSVSSIGDSADKANSRLSNLGGGFSFSGLVNTATSASNSISEVGHAAESSSGKLRIMDTALGVLAGNMLTKGVDAVMGMMRNFTSGLRDGFAEYELKMNSIQTILANTSKHGTTLEDVTASLEELNDYADKTVYNFGDMTSAIGKFTTTGMTLEESTMSVKGLANAAAHAGANATQLSMVLPQVSQALSKGFFAKEDWKSIQNMGMETEALKETLIKFGIEYGTLTEDMGVTTGNFAQNLTESQWLTKEVWNAAMQDYQDTTTEIGKLATQSATQVKTFTQLISTLKESVGSGWAKTWELLIGNFEEARDNWTEINNIIGGIIGMFGNGRNAIFQEWHDLGGYKDLWTGIINVIRAFAGIFTSIGTAFSQVFGQAKPGVGILLALSSGFAKLTSYIQPGTEGFSILIQVFTLFFNIVKLVGTVLGVLIKMGMVPLKIVLGAVATAISFVIKGLEVFVSWLNKLSKPLIDAIELIGDLFGKGLQQISNNIGAYFTSSIGKAGSVLEGFVAKSSKAGNSIKTLIENSRSGKDAADGLNILEFALRMLIKAFDSVSSKVESIKSLFTALKEGASKGIEPFTNLYSILEKLGEKRGPITGFLFDLITGMKNAGDESFKAANLIQKAGLIIGDFATSIKTKVDEAKKSIKDFFDHSGEGLENFNFGESIAGKIVKGIGIGLLALPAVALAGIINGLSQVFPQVGTWVETQASQLLTKIGFEKINFSELIFGKTAYADTNVATSGIIDVRKNMLQALAKARQDTISTKSIFGDGSIIEASQEQVDQVNKVYEELGINSRITAEELAVMSKSNSMSINEMVNSIEGDINRVNDTIGNKLKKNLKEFGVVGGTLKSAKDAIIGVGKAIKDGLNFDLLRKGLEGTATKAELAKSKMASLGKFLKDKLKFDIKEFDKTISEIKSNLDKNFNTLPKIFKGIVDGIKNVFSNLDFSSKTALIKSLIENIGNWFTGLADIITKISAPIGAVVKVFATMLGDISRGLEGSSLMNVGIIVVIWKLLNILDGGASILDRFLGPFKELLEKIGKIGDARSVLEETAKTIKSYRKGNTAKNIFTLAKAFAVLAGSLFVLSLIPLDKMVPTFLLFAGALLVATAAVIAIQWAMSKIGGGNSPVESLMSTLLESLGFPEMKKLLNALNKATMMTALASSVLMIGMMMVKVKDLSWEQIFKGLVTAGLTMLMLVRIVKIADTGATLGDAARILALAFAIKMIVNLVEAINKLELAELTKAGLVIAGISMIFALAIRMMNPKRMQINMGSAASILALAFGIKMMVGVISQIAAIDSGDIRKGIITIGLLALVMSMAVGLMGGEAGANGFGIQWGSVNLRTAVTILALTVGIGVMATAVAALSAIDPGRLMVAATVIGTLTTILALAVGLMSGSLKTPGGLKVSIGDAKLSNVAMLMAMVGGIIGLALTVAGLSMIDPNKLATATTVLAVIATILVVGIGGILAAFKYLSDPDATDVAMIAVYVMGLVLLSGTMIRLSTIPFEGIMKAVIALGVVILGLISVINISKGAKVADVAMLAVAVLAIWGVTQSLMPFTTMPWEGISKAIVVLGGIVLGLVGLISLAKGSDWVSVGMLATATLSIVAVAFTLKMLSELEGDIVKAGLVLAGVSIAIGIMVALASTGGSLVAIGTLLAATVAVVGIAIALQMLSQISSGDMITAILGLAGALTVITLAGVALTYSGAIVGILGLAAAAAGFGIAAVVFGIGANLVVDALTKLWTLIVTIVTDISSAMSTIVEGISAGIGALPQILVDIWNGLGTFFGSLGEKALEWGGKIIKGIADGIVAGISWIGEAAGNVWDSITSFFSGEDGASKAKESGKKIPEGVAAGMYESKPTVDEATTNLTGGVSEALAGFANSGVNFGSLTGTNLGSGLASTAGQLGLDTETMLSESGINLSEFQNLAGQTGLDSGGVFGSSIASTSGQVGDNTSSVTDASAGVLEQFRKATSGFGTSSMGNFGTSISNQSGAVAGHADKVMGAVKGKLDNQDFSSSGKTIGETFGNGLSSMTSWVGKKASGLIQAVRNMFPNSPAKEGPLSGSGWTKLARSGKAFAVQWATGMGSAVDDVVSEAENIITSVQNTLDTVAEYDFDSMDFVPTVTPVLNMSEVEQVKGLDVNPNINLKNARLNASYADMNMSMARIQQQEQNMNVLANGLQIISDKMSDLLDISENQTRAIENGHVVMAEIDGYNMNRRLAPGMLEAQRQHQIKMNRMDGVIKQI